MRIGELARRAEVSTTRIRFYEAHGLLPKADRLDNGFRDYPESVLDKLRLIQVARYLGFSMNDMKSTLPQAGASEQDLLEALRSRLIGLDQQIDEAKRRRERLVEFIDKFEKEQAQHA